MACDATARLYDVDEDSVVFQRLDQTEKYDQGTVAFRARQGRLIDLDKLHESIWATRLSGGTRSGLVSLDVTAVGRVVSNAEGLFLHVSNADSSSSGSQFALGQGVGAASASTFKELQAVAETNQEVRLSGRIDDYRGRWPDVLRNLPTKPRRILVTAIEAIE